MNLIIPSVNNLHLLKIVILFYTIPIKSWLQISLIWGGDKKELRFEIFNIFFSKHNLREADVKSLLLD